jgi:hypothetical protein
MRYRVNFDAGLMRVENLASTGIRDHLRYCTPPYAGIASLGTHLISNVLKPGPAAVSSGRSLRTFSLWPGTPPR